MKVKTIGAKQGSIVKAAAYRSGEKIDRQKTGEKADYRRKQGIAYTEIIAPESAEEWAKNRAQLWNKVEEVDIRRNSRYAREVVLALPHELGAEQNIVLVQEYVKSNFVSMGMVADIAIHVPDPSKASDGKYLADQRNLHCHILLTDRPLAGQTFAKKKDRSWNDKKKLISWRKGWADMLNTAFETEGLEQRFDHRSYEKQGVDMIPQVHEGKIATGMKRRKAKLDPEEYSEIASKIEHNDLVKEHNKVVAEIQEIEERKRQRKPDKKRDTTNKSTPSELSERSSTPPTSGSEADAVQNTAELERVTVASSQFGVEPHFEEVPKASNKNDSAFKSTKARADRRGRFKPKREYYTDARTAIEIASKTKVHIKGKDKDISAVTAYRLALADIANNAKQKNMAYHYHKQTESALECDRVIRDYMRRRGFNNREISRAMRRASPAMYRKSRAEATIYAKRFNAYARAKKVEENINQRAQEKRNEKIAQDVKKRRKKRRRGRRF